MTYCGTPDYLSPEMIKKEGHDTHIDVWNLGVLLFEMLTGRPPFQGANQKELFDNILKLKINYTRDFPKLAKDLVAKLLKVNPKERISLKNALLHPWFRSNPELRPVLTKTLKVDRALPTLESDLDEDDYEPVSRVSKVNREESKKPITIRIKADPLKSFDEQKKADKDVNLSEIGSKLQKATTDYNELKVLHKSTKHIIERIKKENDDLKSHVGSSEKGYISPDKAEIRKLNEELQKMKVVVKNRNELANELEKRAEDLSSIKEKYQLLEAELTQEKAIKEGLEEKLAEAQSKNTEYLKKITALKSIVKEEKFQKETFKAQLEVKLDELQHHSTKKSSEALSSSFTDISPASFETFKKTLDEIKNRLTSEACHKQIEEKLRQDYLALQKQHIEMKNKYENQLYEARNSMTLAVEEAKRESLATSFSELQKKDKILEEYSFQLAQFEASEARSAMESHQLRSLQAQNTQYQKIVSDLKQQVSLLSRGHNSFHLKMKSFKSKPHDSISFTKSVSPKGTH